MTADPDLLAAVAHQLVTRVRDDNPQANARWLTAQLPDPDDWFRLLFVLAAAVPDDQPWTTLTAWTRQRLCGLSPSGHRRRNERVCDDCRRWDRQRKHRDVA